MTRTYQLVQGKIIETTTEVREHDPEKLLAALNAQKADIEAGKESYLADVNARIASIEDIINTINSLNI